MIRTLGTDVKKNEERTMFLEKNFALKIRLSGTARAVMIITLKKQNTKEFSSADSMDFIWNIFA
ncbi:MAG: hypothetical protein MR488_10415 [Lachnospiraceae bacterium]|nr:hypothetical protein [Lachnospiraceae bacterium]